MPNVKTTNEFHIHCNTSFAPVTYMTCSKIDVTSSSVADITGCYKL